MSYLFHITESSQFHFWNIVGTKTNCRGSVCGMVERARKQAQLGSH